MQQFRRLSSYALLLVLVTACGGDSPSDPGGGVSVNGRWTYVIPALPHLGPVVDLTITENNQGTIAGTGTILDADPYSVVVSGAHSHPTVTLTAVASVCTAVFSGTFTDNNTITGTAVAQNAVPFRDCRQGTWTLKRQ